MCLCQAAIIPNTTALKACILSSSSITFYSANFKVHSKIDLESPAVEENVYKSTS